MTPQHATVTSRAAVCYPKYILLGFSIILSIIVGPTAWAQEIKADFRRAKVDPGEFNWDGLKAEAFITSEADGLRWRFTKDRNPKRAVGISWKTRLDGDFTATAQYDILRADRPAKGGGIGPEMYLTLDTPEPRDGIVLTRGVQPNGDAIVSFHQMTNDENKNRVARVIARVATTPGTLKGRMRVARAGKTFIASLAEADDDHYKEIGRAEIGDMRVLKLRFAGLDGGSPNPELDMRLLEFHLTEKELVTPLAKPGDAANPKGVPDQPQPEMRRASLWIIIGIVGVMVMLLLAGGVIFVVSQLRGTPKKK